MLKEDLERYLWQTKQPWEVLHYKLIWSQIADIIDAKKLKVLDFGSGLGITANYFAKNNEVTAIEPNIDIIQVRERENIYTQIHGDYKKLKDFTDNSFDMIICHNVLHFAEERTDIVKEFSRLIKKEGLLSIMMQNKHGKVLFKIVFENNIDEAINLIDNDETSDLFGNVTYFSPDDLVEWGENLKIEKVLASRILGKLQNNDVKYAQDWVDKMLKVEKKVCDLEPYKNMGHCYHVLLRKV